jgi:hypothetical protein
MTMIALEMRQAAVALRPQTTSSGGNMQNAAEKSPDSRYSRVRTIWKPEMGFPVV